MIGKALFYCKIIDKLAKVGGPVHRSYTNIIGVNYDR